MTKFRDVYFCKLIYQIFPFIHTRGYQTATLTWWWPDRFPAIYPDYHHPAVPTARALSKPETECKEWQFEVASWERRRSKRGFGLGSRPGWLIESKLDASASVRCDSIKTCWKMDKCVKSPNEISLFYLFEMLNNNSFILVFPHIIVIILFGSGQHHTTTSATSCWLVWQIYCCHRRCPRRLASASPMLRSFQWLVIQIRWIPPVMVIISQRPCRRINRESFIVDTDTPPLVTTKNELFHCSKQLWVHFV